MVRREIRITGFGGQGVVLCGYIIGRACAVNAGMQATMIQSFGPEARGSACSATLVVSDRTILYPYIRKLGIFVAMSSEGYEKYHDQLSDDGILIYEENLVHPAFKDGQSAFGIPSTRIAESLGRVIVQNIVMLGFFGEVTRIVTSQAMREAVKMSVPSGTTELNLKALDAGIDYFQKVYGKERADRQVEVTVPAGGQ